MSTRDQNIDRQTEAMHVQGLTDKHLYIDKQSGKNFKRPAYQRLMCKLKPGDVVIVKSIDRLGRNYDEILDQWRQITKVKQAEIYVLGMPLLDTPQDIDNWNAGRIPVAIAHPASIGHGLNLQDGGHIIIWYGPTWSLELYQQANERLNRPGQQHVCRIYHLILKGTYDERVLAALARKDKGQAAALDALRLDILGGRI